jgi:predicted O-methyltransferase YrrM
MTISLPWRNQRHNNGPVIQSSLTDRETRALGELASQSSHNGISQRVLEIGSAYGFSSITMALAGANVVSIDHHQHMNSEPVMVRNLSDYRVSDMVGMIIADSRNALPTLLDHSFDGAFIDGDHTTEGVLFDAKECLRLVKPGGWIAFHDYNESSCPEIAPALDQLFGINSLDRILIDTLYIVKVPYPKPVYPIPPLLTIATLTIPSRKLDLQGLMIEIAFQIGDEPVEHLIEEGPERYGVKMRRSLERSSGQYVCWLDDDDLVHPAYVSSILKGIRSTPTPDVVTFGSYTPGNPPAWLRWGVTDDYGLREDGYGKVKTANHYCAWRRDIVMSVPWLPRNYGAELAWYTGLRHEWRGKITEHHIPEVLHTYCYNPNGTQCQDRPSIDDSLKDGGNKVTILRHKEGVILMAKGWDKNPTTYKAQWPNGFTLTVPSEDVKIVDSIVYR